MFLLETLKVNESGNHLERIQFHKFLFAPIFVSQSLSQRLQIANATAPFLQQELKHYYII
jgi:hypothetical protein